MKKSLEELIYYSVHYHNILPLTSACNMECIFCSHRFNPPQLEIYSLPSRSLEEIAELLDFLDPEKKIVIGESVTRIIEGEPFLHPNFLDILQIIRERYFNTPLQITTNGSLLSREKAEKLAEFFPLEINLSLNSATPSGRERLMKDRRTEISLEAAALLKEYKIPFHGSIVAMPMLVGWQDLEKTIFYLEQQGAQTIRVFLPGYTDYNLPFWNFSEAFREELRKFVEGMRERTEAPLILEPQPIDNLEARVEGVIKGTPAWQAGIRRGDRILQVNEVEPGSRVEAFNLIQKEENPDLFLARAGEKLHLSLGKKAEESSGLVFAYDLDLTALEDWQEAARRHQASRVLLLTSVLGEKVIKAALEILADQNVEWQVEAVENKLLGGSIIAGGLLTVRDFRDFFKSWAEKNENQPDLILLSSRSFDSWGRDLMGESYLELAEELQIKIELIFS